MRCILTLLICLTYLNLNSNINSLKGKKLVSIVNYMEDGESVSYKKQYNSIIEKLKKQEGFRAFYYMDKNYVTIGYGQRIKFYPKHISEPITEEQGEEILRISYGNHLKAVRKLYPNVSDTKALRLAHISYQCGIVKVIKSMKYGNKRN